MERFDTDVVVIGAGAVGLACARAIAMAGREVIILEAADAMMTETSSRNSEVVHAGLYYPTGSLKAKLCVAGKHALYDWAQIRGVPHKRCGKLIVAAGPAEDDQLQAIERRALQNDVPDVALISGAEARRMEPSLSPDLTRALWSPSTGLFDSHAFGLSLLGEAQDHGAVIAYGARVSWGEATSNGFSLRLADDLETIVDANMVVNASGHGALELARRFDGGPHYPELAMHWCKGSYFALSGAAPFQRSIYPAPNEASLGLHYTLDLGGRGRFGPDAQWLDADAGPPFDYAVDPARGALFYDAVRRYWPGLPDGALSPDYAGVRPKLVGEGEAPADFMISGPTDHGVLGLVHLIGIESPGLTASLAVGDYVVGLLDLS